MATYRISGIWKNTDDVITHYAFHEEGSTTMGRAQKVSKTRAIQILETRGVTATTWIWNYQTAWWSIGENVEVVNGQTGKYLRSDPDDKLTDNLGHLLDYDWISQ